MSVAPRFFSRILLVIKDGPASRETQSSALGLMESLGGFLYVLYQHMGEWETRIESDWQSRQEVHSDFLAYIRSEEQTEETQALTQLHDRALEQGVQFTFLGSTASPVKDITNYITAHSIDLLLYPKPHQRWLLGVERRTLLGLIRKVPCPLLLT